MFFMLLLAPRSAHGLRPRTAPWMGRDTPDLHALFLAHPALRSEVLVVCVCVRAATMCCAAGSIRLEPIAAQSISTGIPRPFMHSAVLCGRFSACRPASQRSSLVLALRLSLSFERSAASWPHACSPPSHQYTCDS